MPGSIIRATNDAEEFRGQIRPADRDYIVLRRGVFSGRTVKVDLNQVWLQKISETLPRSWSVQIERIALAFPLAEYGSKMSDANFVGGKVDVILPGRTLWHSTPPGSEVASLSIAAEALAVLGPALAGRDIVISRDLRSLQILPATMQRLRRLHKATIHLAETAPEIITNEDAARGLDEALADLFIECLTQEDAGKESTASRRHRATIQRLHDLAEQHAEEPLFLSEVCQKLGVARRTLELCCREHIGTSPKRYLTLRRLHLAHTALRRASPDQTSVTEIATRYGFWELGRFAVEYRSVFGETPSASLRSSWHLSAVHARGRVALSA